MNFLSDGTSPQEIALLVAQMGLDAVTTNRGDDGDNDGKKNSENQDIAITTGDDFICAGCDADPCVFFEHHDSLLAFNVAEHAGLVIEDTVPNNTCRIYEMSMYVGAPVS